MCSAARAAAPGALVAAADAEALPFGAAAFDLVVSTSTFQWLTRLGPAFSEARRVLVPGGAFCLALFGAHTLSELREAWRGAAGPGGAGRTHHFFSREEVAAALDHAGLHADALEEEELVEWHPDARSVLRALKQVGAASAVPGRAGLGGRAVTLEMLRRYEALHAGPEGVPATYHVVYAVARRR
jgi:malonyl-CoA O-methyltransferase